MLSSSRKYRKSFDNYQQAIEKQLNDDFQVYQYLNQNKLQGNNIDDYLKLFNELQVKKNQQKRKFQSLQLSFVQMNSESINKSLKTSQVQNWGGAKEQFLKKYEQTQIKMSNQNQVKNNLWKQIIETKKSLNLLKGDIGHLISRNQAAKTLESKISKVKIVADDQLQRVSMAYTKDKDQLKQRGQMQKKFNKKLKNVSMMQDTTLNRLKRNYLNTMVRKKEIHDRLNYIERIKGSINQPGELEKQKNLINRNILELYKNFARIKNLIQKIPIVQNQYGCTSEQIEKFVKWLKNQENYKDDLQIEIKPQQQQIKPIVHIHRSLNKESTQLKEINSSDLQMINQTNLKEFQTIIKEENRRITEQILKHQNIYNMEMKKSEELVAKMQIYDQEISTFQRNLYEQEANQYILTQESREQFSSKLKKFVSFLKTIFTLLQYIQKNLNYTSIPFQFKNRSLNQSQISFIEQIHSCSQTGFQNLLKVPQHCKKQYKSEKSLTWMSKSYISELFKTYYTLLKDDISDKQISTIEINIFNQLQNDVENWLSLIKQYYVNGTNIKLPTYWERELNQRQVQKVKNQKNKGRESRVSLIKNQKKEAQTQEQQALELKQQDQFTHQNYKRRYTMIQKQRNPSNRQNTYSKIRSISPQAQFREGDRTLVHRNTMHNMSNSSSPIVNVNKLTTNVSVSEFKQAQRIKLLKDIDKDYYKMLKSTLKMEKQNTRKNYQFIKTFKRAKYSSNDEILEEKRFECSYSMLFSTKKDQATGPQNSPNQKSIFFKNNRNKKGVQKNGESRKKFQSSKIVKSSNVSLDLKQNSIRQFKENNKKFKQTISRSRIYIKNKQNLTTQMKDILNLI